MTNPQILHVEVVYARSDVQQLAAIELGVGATAHDALRLSGLLQQFPEIELTTCKLGIFGRTIGLQHVLRDGDRVEIYRELPTDPKQARRERAWRQR
ncbi:MAG: RnfH family protein [Gammaproteobacteria bacterium]|nr:RnfH family protein [Gammaproteobacteria bacterium]MBU6508612.1 RnfH family protein [Gammaproteobacteria bacterium]MDE1983099.1 RnfH family protein [Gammaproteobacteria bacterium]MDE2107588.1 RnfH family protein [Gammaproteobacteria bacterium]